MPDAITTLRDDHKRVEKLFKEFEKLEKNDGSASKKRTVVEQIIEELSVHAAIEEQVFYPAVRKLEDVGDVVLEGLEEHHIVKWTLSELDGMNGDEERFDAKVKVLIESVRHHVEEEESEMFPKVREAMGRKPLIELCEKMEKLRKTAPTKPHPRMPDEPPANLVAGAAAGLTDREGKSGLLGRRRAKEGLKS